MTDKTLQIKSQYHPEIVEEIKSLEGARWNPDKKLWTVDNSERNLYSLSTLERSDPRYSLSLPKFEKKDFPISDKLMSHQEDMVRQEILRRRVIIGGEMGTGKTFAALEAMAFLTRINPNKSYFWICCPKSARYSWESEIKKWRFPLKEWDGQGSNNGKYRFISYSSLEKYVAETSIEEQPNHIFFDEAHALKNPGANRTKAAIILSSILRAKDPEAAVVLMTGTPQPKDPTDWWALTEICQAGYLRESNKNKLASRLGEFENMVGQSGQEFRKLVRWKPEELKILRARLKGMVHIYLKKDCLDLPDKIYIPVFLPFDEKMKKQIALLVQMQGKGITCLAKLRQRSDGFLYHSVCSGCQGTGTHQTMVGEISCGKCGGSGDETIEVETPKDKQFLADLEELEENENRRVVVYAGFHKSIDKLFRILEEKEWRVIRLDGRGLKTSGGIDPKEWEKYWNNSEEKVAFLGHPKAGGMGLNLQKAEVMLRYSLDFDGASYSQAEDRIHRIGTTKAVYKDYLWLPTDYYVLGFLKEKRNLQGVTTGEIQEYIKTFSQEKFYAFGEKK